MSDVLVLIPALLPSNRLPANPLADIAVLPMVGHVLPRAVAAAGGRVLVPTESDASATGVEKAGGGALRPRADHPSGSDRVFEALGTVFGDVSVVVNVQGGLPTLQPDDVRAALAPLADAAVDISTIAAAIRDQSERDNPNVVMVVGTPVDPGRLRRPSLRRVSPPL